MRELVNTFPEQVKESIEIANAANLTICNKELKNVCISGLGGSGIGGTIVSQLTASSANLPIYVNKDYHIPGFVNDATLFIASSYSGNTEETLESLAQAQKAGAEIACITSGGKLKQIAEENNYNLIVIPAGLPPRAAFGYSSVQQFRLLSHYNIIDKIYLEDVTNVPTLLNENKESIIKEAEALTDALYDKIPVIYSEATFEGVGVRFRQQINENSKMLCWHHALPEMNHNELVSWAPEYKNCAVVLFRNQSDYSRTQTRMEFTKERVSPRASSVTEVWSKGNNLVERAYYLIYVGDWVSVLLAEKQGIDPVEVDIITKLKSTLAEQ